ncbi:uncharacterized protein [Palaemon carinicauda]|uniref:uncharacterized protein isoform X1 n=1 Tax=Palaemon carinicauda TaxID=392227 RepID=UPI0035B5C083
MASTLPLRTSQGHSRHGGPPIHRTGLPLVTWVIAWFLYLAAFSAGQVLREYRIYEHIEFGYGIGPGRAYKSISEASNLGHCRMLCLAELRCKSVTILEADGQTNCDFSELTNIGHLDKIPGAVTIFMTPKGPYSCDAPFVNVRGVGCILVVDRVAVSRAVANDICATKGAKLFYAENPQHLRRLYTNFLSVRAVTGFDLWVWSIPNLWWADPYTNRTIQAEEVDSGSYIGSAAHVINPNTGKLVGKDRRFPYGYICEKKLAWS